MLSIAKGIGRMVASYLAVILVIILMPVFLITNDVALLDSLQDFIFQNNS